MALFALSKKADYGLVMLAELAKLGKGQVMSTAQLVKAKGLPRAFAAQIAKDLVEAGILGSKEGKGGGYFLKKDPGEIRVREVLEAIDGKLAPTACAVGKTCVCSEQCEQKGFMQKLGDDVGRVLDGYTLNEVVGQ